MHHNLMLESCIEGTRGVFVSMSEALMTWHEYITTDPEVLCGKPVVRGTRLAVDFLLGLMAAGWTREQVLENYPHLTEEGLRAVFAYAAEVMQDESLHVMRRNQ